MTQLKINLNLRYLKYAEVIIIIFNADNRMLKFLKGKGKKYESSKA